MNTCGSHLNWSIVKAYPSSDPLSPPPHHHFHNYYYYYYYHYYYHYLAEMTIRLVVLLASGLVFLTQGFTG